MKQQERGTYAEEEKCNHERGGLCCVREPSLKSVTKKAGATPASHEILRQFIRFFLREYISSTNEYIQGLAKTFPRSSRNINLLLHDFELYRFSFLHRCSE